MTSQDLPKPGYSLKVFRVPAGELNERWDRILNGCTDLDFLRHTYEHTKVVAARMNWPIVVTRVKIQEQEVLLD